MYELTEEEKEQRKRLDERLKGKKREPCPESDFMICYDEDFIYESNRSAKT